MDVTGTRQSASRRARRQASGPAASRLAELDAQLEAAGVDLDEDLDTQLDVDAPARDLEDPYADESWLTRATFDDSPLDHQLDDEQPATASSDRSARPPVQAPRTSRALPPTTPFSDDLPPLTVPPGYFRDGRGAWRYESSGRAVPGARDLTLDRLHCFPVVSRWVVVPVGYPHRYEELAWVLDVADPLGPSDVVWAGRAVSTVAVPTEEWSARARVPLGLVAPELDVRHVVGLDDIAGRLGVNRATISSYLARGRLPDPVCRVAGSPVWSQPIIEAWLASRPGQGARTDRLAAASA